MMFKVDDLDLPRRHIEEFMEPVLGTGVRLLSRFQFGPSDEPLGRNRRKDFVSATDARRVAVGHDPDFGIEMGHAADERGLLLTECRAHERNHVLPSELVHVKDRKESFHHNEFR